MKKRLLTAIALTLCLSLFTCAQAKEITQANTHIFSGDIALSAEEEAEYIASLTDEDLQRIANKTQVAQELYASEPMTRAGVKISIPGTFVMRMQETDYYCAPATAQAMIRYLTGTIYEQTEIAQRMGTTPADGTNPFLFLSYLNYWQNVYEYDRSINLSFSNMCSYLKYTVSNMHYPASMAIENYSSSNWHYLTTGHRMVVNAVYSDDSRIQFADPLGKKQADWPVFYEVDSATVHTVCRDIVW